MKNPQNALEHLHPDARERLSLPAEQRIEYIRSVKPFQESVDLQDDFKVFDLILDQGPGERRRNIRLLGDPGLGKTSILREISRRNPSAIIPGTTMWSMPVVILCMTALGSVEEFCDYLEKTIGIPPSIKKRGARARIEECAQFLNRAHCKIAAFDEFQDLMKAKADVRRYIIQLVKVFVHNARFPVCVSGSEESITALSDCKHMRARFRTCVERKSWSNNDHFLTWIFGLVGRFPLKNPSRIFDRETLTQIIARSEGNTETIVFSTRMCAIDGVKSGRETIDRDQLLKMLLV